MKGYLLYATFIVCMQFVITSSLKAQYCNGGSCSNIQSQNPSSTLTPISSWQTTASCSYGGQYSKYNVIKGNTYDWTTCNDYGGSQGTNFDAELTLYSNSWSALCFNDNTGISNCPYAPYIRWTATYTGIVYLLISNAYYSQCQNYTSTCAKIRYIESATGCTNWSVSPSTQSVSSSGGSYSAQVSATGTCSYSLTFNNSSWIHFSHYSSNGYFNYTVDNNNGAARTGTISVNNVTSGINNVVTLTINQSGSSCSSVNTPTNLNATSVSTSQINLSWQDNSNNETTFQIERSTTSSPSGFSLYATVNANQTSYSDNGLNPNTQYWYRVRACCNTTYSGYSGTSSATTQSTCNHSLSPQSNTSIGLSGGGYSINISVNSGCLWNASTTNNWISITSGSNGNGSGNCYYVVSSNTTGATRTGSILIAGQTFTIKQYAIPVASFTSITSNISAGGSVQFYDASSNSPTSWQWTFTGGSPSTTITKTSQNPSVTFATPGTYKVSLVVSNIAGASNPKTVNGYVTVNNTPGQCVEPEKINVIGVNYCQENLADPIQIGTGTYRYQHTDFNIPVIAGSLVFTRFYNSYNNARNSPLGYGWSHSFAYSVENFADTIWDVTYPDGHKSRFIPLYNGNGTSFPLYGGTYDSLVKTSGEFWMYTKEQNVLKFTTAGRLYQIADPNGNQISLSYSGNDLTSIQGPGGRTLSMSYSSGTIISVQSPLGRICRYGYDGNGNLEYAVSPKGDTTRYTYNSSHSMLQVINGLGDTILGNTYDTQNRVISQADAYNVPTTITYNTPAVGTATIIVPGPDSLLSTHDEFYRVTKSVDACGKARMVSYDDDNNPDTVTNEKSQQATSTYDAYGNPITQVLPGNRIYTSAYNKFQKPTEIVNPRGNKTVFSYDGNGNLLSVRFPDSSSHYFSYNSNGTLQRHINGTNDTTTFFYNSYGDLVKVAHPNGNIAYGYDADGRLDSIRDENGSLTRITLDNNDNITKITDALNQHLSFTYDADDQLTVITDKKGYTTRLYYDRKGRLIARKNAMNGIDSFVYDTRDNLIRWKDANGHNTSYEYDENGRRVSTTNWAGKITSSYDEIGNITEITDPKQQTTLIGYSASNLVSSIVNAAGHKDSLEFDNIGNVKKLINYRGKTRHYAYDSLNRPASVVDVDNETTSYTYDLGGNIKKLRDGNGHFQFFSFEKGRLTSYTDGANNTYTLAYDSAGNVTTITKPVGSITKTYDPLNRLIKVTMTTGGTNTYGYDANDNLTVFSHNSDTSRFFYDSLNRIVKYIDPFGKQVLYGYDAVGNRTKLVYPDNQTVLYTYDPANRLRTVTDWLNNKYTYSYDSAGNVKELLYSDSSRCVYAYDAINRITSKFSYTKSNVVIYGQQYRYFNDSIEETRFGGSYPIPPSSRRTYQYRSDDAVLTDSIHSFNNDNNGNRTQEIHASDTITYSFTTDQLLSSRKQHGITTTYTYDGLGHRISRTEETTQTRYVLNLNSPLSHVLQTTDASDRVKANYIYGLGLLSQIDSAGTILLYYFDTRHNTIAIKDKQDSIRARYAYSLYGLVNTQPGFLQQPFTFLGEFGVEQETDSCYYIRARYYDAATGRFLSKDPLFGDEFEPQSLNRYAYAMNNPVTMYDVTGLCGDKDNAHPSTSYPIVLGTMAAVSPWPAALGSSGVLLADDATAIGVVDDLAIPIILTGALTYDATQRIFLTYTLTNFATGQIYIGRTSGFGNPISIMNNRYISHHMRSLGFSNPTLDVTAQGIQSYPAIRGREQQLIDYYGGVGSEKVANNIRGVSKINPLGRVYNLASDTYFGKKAPYSGH